MTAERNVAIEGTTRFFPARTGKARRNWHEYSIEWRLCGILLHRPHGPLLAEGRRSVLRSCSGASEFDGRMLFRAATT